MERTLETLLNVGVKNMNRSISGGCINSGSVYQTEDKKLFFVKENSKPGVITDFSVLLFLVFLNIFLNSKENL